MKAVVVEDEILIREGLCKLMKKMFPEIIVVSTAGNGREGLSCVERDKPDLVITDIRMPVMDGLEMIAKMQEAGIFPKIIVLTAYSEFSYAQQAVKLGVNDYIIKPVEVREFVRTIRKIQNLHEQEQKRMPDTMGNLENIVSGILYGTSVLEKEMESFLEKKYGIAGDTPLIELLMYMGEEFENDRKRKRNEMCRILQDKEVKYALVDMEYDKVILALIYGYSSKREIERWYQNQILFQNRGSIKQKISYGMIEVAGPGKIREGYHNLLPYMDWNIVLGADVLISYPHIADVQSEICIYPVELENQVKTAVCMGENEKVKEIIGKFHRYFLNGHVYSPKEIKESCVRFQWSVLNIAKEVGCIDYKKIDQKKLLDSIMNARTEGELEKTFEELLCYINVSGEETGAVSLAVRKARSMIHEFYADGITLSEIAGRLNLTQEYLGTQFHREIGENFSAYIRNYRMAKAKELLIGTQLKQYEISEKVGYTDAKYFARVFKECVGMSPAEYRKSNR
ncbi:response regulator transcription factor [Parablautia intestinalis]|uniref:response regulator transcription factor n=1 Tax=Parablautia intestinalis TaxID=2320100 RepID=UPI00259CBBEC|nr:response regulator [Parablautia intestinalis]